MLITGMLYLFTLPTIQAQEIILKRNHPISLKTDLTRPDRANGTLNVVAVMVEFQPDSNRLTSGTGIFGPNGYDGLPFLSREEKTYIDPLPHNQDYFESHLEFAKNYFLKSSDGKLTLDYQVLPGTYRLDKPMEEYSPIGENFSLEKIAELMHDVWQKVDESGKFDPIAMGLDPDNTAFVIFHAGVGRDVELTGTSLDITPFDIPSIYLEEENIGNLLNQATFDGFAIDGGTFHVKNSMIIPRTESRRGEDIQDNEIVFPLSINGLLCASIGSYLGLPDLFNTENGQPAIGRFGLMDGAGFFNYNGLIPPEPSAWEKVFLGWETPVTISADQAGETPLPAASMDQPNSIAKIELSSTEYFLIENRHRDPNLSTPDAAEVTITTKAPVTGSLTQKTFTNLDEDFIYQAEGFDTLLDMGTIVDVSNFDWSLPGGIDPGNDNEIGGDDDRHLNGGILIWHIDENVIAQGLAGAGVNADENLRGVDLEEADGAQDIGRDAGLLDNSPSFGFAYDFWWSGNNYRVETFNGTIDLNPDNIFGPESFPNNNSNSGARSGFELYEFSDNQSVASFKIRAASETQYGITQILSVKTDIDSLFSEGNEYLENYPLSLQISEFPNESFLVVPSSNRVTLFDLDNFNTPRASYVTGISGQPLAAQHNMLVIPTVQNGGTSQFLEVGADTLIRYPVNQALGKGFVSQLRAGFVEFDFTGLEYSLEDLQPAQVSGGYEFRSEIVSGKYAGVVNNVATFEATFAEDYSPLDSEILFSGTIKSNQGTLFYVLTNDNLTLINPDSDHPLTAISRQGKSDWPAFADNGRIFWVDEDDNSIMGYNFNGALLSHTPIPAPEGYQFKGTPLIADVNGDEVQDILVVSQSDFSVNIFGFDLDGNQLEGFPLYVGGSVGADITPIHPAFFGDVIYAISHTGDLKAWKFENFTNANWPTKYGQGTNNKATANITFPAQTSGQFSVLNPAETYNWPNPADETTNIRFEVERPGGTVEITIIDYSGRVVFERTVEAKGGAPEEIEISTTRWGSGAYFARVKATVEGRSESKLIKIGVAH